MALNIETGHSVTADVQQVNSKTVRFVTEDGRTMFEVSVGKDGKSIEVRGVETTKVDGVLYSECLEIRPRFANCVEIRTQRYEDT